MVVAARRHRKTRSNVSTLRNGLIRSRLKLEFRAHKSMVSATMHDSCYLVLDARNRRSPTFPNNMWRVHNPAYEWQKITPQACR